jgi:hypothetical protein
MNRNVYHANKSSNLYRIFRFGKLQGLSLALVLIFSMSVTAAAQYPGGAGGTSNYPGGTRPNYGSKGAVIGGVVAGAAVGAGLLYWKLHNRAKLQGCIAGEGDKLVDEKTNQTYSLTDKQGQSLKGGERVELLVKKIKDGSGRAMVVSVQRIDN